MHKRLYIKEQKYILLAIYFYTNSVGRQCIQKYINVIYFNDLKFILQIHDITTEPNYLKFGTEADVVNIVYQANVSEIRIQEGRG